MPARNSKFPELAQRLAYARENHYKTYERMCERFLNDAAFIAEHKVIDPATISRWIKSASLPEGVATVLHRILAEDGIPDCLAEERKAFQQIEPVGMIEYQEQVVRTFLNLAKQHPQSPIDFYMVPAHLRSTVAWLEEIGRKDMAHRVGAIKCKTMRPDLLLSLVDGDLLDPEYVESFVFNFRAVRQFLKRHGGAASDISVIGHFHRIPPFHATMIGVGGKRLAAWAERWEADDDGRLGVDTSWIRPVLPQRPTQGLFDRLTALFDRMDIAPVPGCAEPCGRSASDWRKAVLAASTPSKPATPRRRSSK